jgi:hypothetical protein
MEEGATRPEASMTEQQLQAVTDITELMMNGSVEQGVDAARQLRNLSLPFR